MSAAQIAYEEDVRRCPRYHHGALRPSWEALGEIARSTWERNPTPREFHHPRPTTELTPIATHSTKPVQLGLWGRAGGDEKRT